MWCAARVINSRYDAHVPRSAVEVGVAGHSSSFVRCFLFAFAPFPRCKVTCGIYMRIQYMHACGSMDRSEYITTTLRWWHRARRPAGSRAARAWPAAAGRWVLKRNAHAFHCLAGLPLLVFICPPTPQGSLPMHPPLTIPVVLLTSPTPCCLLIALLIAILHAQSLFGIRSTGIVGG